MDDTLLLWLALACSILSLGPLFVAAWGLTGGDGDPPNAVAAVLGIAVGLAGLTSVGAAARQLALGPSWLTVGTMAAPVALFLLGLLAAGPPFLRGEPGADLTADDVRGIGLDPDEYGFGRADRVRDAALATAAWVLPVAGPLLVLATRRL